MWQAPLPSWLTAESAWLCTTSIVWVGAFAFGGEYRSCRIVKSGSRWWICGDPLGATTSKRETRPETESHPFGVNTWTEISSVSLW